MTDEPEKEQEPPKRRSRKHEPRLLVPGAKRRGADPVGYTDIPALAMRDEPEALSRDDYERHVLGRAQTAAEQQAAIEAARLERSRRLLTFEERLSAAMLEAKRRSMDVSSEMYVLGRMRAAGKDVRHLEQRLGALERRVFRNLDDGEAA